MIPATLLERASRRLVTVDRSARLVDAAQAFDRPETLLIIVCDESGVLRGVVSPRTSSLASAIAPAVPARNPSKPR